MTEQEAMKLALDAMERCKVQPLDDQDWMNPDDKEAVCVPFAQAILVAYQTGHAEGGDKMRKFYESMGCFP